FARQALRSSVDLLRTCLCAVIALAPACCPDARPARKTSRESGDPINVLATALARAIERNAPAAPGGGEKAGTESAGGGSAPAGGGGKHKKAGKSAPAGDATKDEHIPKPRISPEMLEKAKEQATQKIT